jgi:hypothetical protein
MVWIFGVSFTRDGFNAVLLAFALLASARAQPSSLWSQLKGNVSGQLQPFGSDLVHQVHWRVTTRNDETGKPTAKLIADGTGLAIRLNAQPAASGADWKIEEAWADFTVWFPVLAQRFLPSFSGSHASGRLIATGQGGVAGTRVAGRLEIAWEGGAFFDDTRGWSLQAIEARAVFPHWPSWETEPSQVFFFRDGELAGIPLRNGRVVFSFSNTGDIRVASAEIEALGGRLSLEPFSFDPSKPEIRTRLRVNGLELGELRHFLPKAVADMTGKLDGELQARWTLESGLELGEGRLNLSQGRTAALRLASAPGFFTSRVPAKIQLLPAWMGTLAAATAPENPAYRTLQQVEQGQMPLQIESIQADFHPGGDAAGHTAVVRIVAHPANVEAVKKVSFTINVAGPLVDVLRFGLSDRISFGW